MHLADGDSVEQSTTSHAEASFAIEMKAFWCAENHSTYREKYPEMSDLNNFPGRLKHSRTLPGSADPPLGISRRYCSDATILLVGLFGAGKKTLGIIASVALRRRFV